MIQDKTILREIIGVVSSILSDIELEFISNNNYYGSISDIVALYNDDNFVLCQIKKIEIDYFLDNPKQYFISKAVQNQIHTINDNAPRHGKVITLRILGYYTYNGLEFIEEKNKINRYTPRVFQPIYSIDIGLALQVFGLAKSNSISNEVLNTVNLGYLVYPIPKISEPVKLSFSNTIFHRHTLITGVTGSGKSRLASLIVNQLATQGFHVSILDPHDEYSEFLTLEGVNVFKYYGTTYQKNSRDTKFEVSKINFYEKSLDPSSLAKLIPSLSPQQETQVYEIFNSLKVLTTEGIILNLMENLNKELNRESLKVKEKILLLEKECEQVTTKKVEFTNLFMNGLRKISDLDKNSKAGVLIAIIAKINELREQNLISSIEPNWLRSSPFSIDLFQIDYSTNDYIRRFINSVLQFTLRQKKQANRVFIIDEAHLLLKDNEITISLVKQLLREGRKYGISVVFISQNTSDIPKDIATQFQNHFLFREQDGETSIFPDRICKVKIYGAKSSLSMHVKSITANK